MTASLRFRLVVFALSFGLIYAALQGAGVTARWVEAFTVPSAVWAINLLQLAPQPASAAGHSIVAPGGGLNVLQGCEGWDMLSLWLAATTAGAFNWRGRLLAWTLGLGLVFTLNQLRLISLFWIWRERPAWFDAAHGLWWPLLLVLAVLVLYLAWSRLFAPESPDVAGALGPAA